MTPSNSFNSTQAIQQMSTQPPPHLLVKEIPQIIAYISDHYELRDKLSFMI